MQTPGARTPGVCVMRKPEGRLMAVEPNREDARMRKGKRVGLRFQAEDCVVLAGHSA